MDSNLSSSHSAPPPCIEKLREDFICTICLNIFFEPVTISCGHTFCRNCLLIAMDKSKKKCPVCRHWINISKENFPNVSIVMWNTIQALFPQEVESRKETSTSIASQEAHNGNMESSIRPMVENAVRGALSEARSEIRPIVENAVRRELSQPEIRLLFQNEIRLALEELCRSLSRPRAGSSPPPPPSSSS